MLCTFIELYQMEPQESKPLELISRAIYKSFFAIILARKRAFVGGWVGVWRAPPATHLPNHLSTCRRRAL